MAGAGERTAALEAELALAREPDVYLVLDVEGSRLEIRARGVVLDSVPLRDLGVLVWGPSVGEAEAPVLPVSNRVERGVLVEREIVVPALDGPPVAAGERVEAPPEGEEREESAQVTLRATLPSAAALPYQVALDSGWRLRIGETVPGRGPGRRLVGMLRGLWSRGEAERPPVLALAMEREDAERIRHLLRDGRGLVVRR